MVLFFEKEDDVRLISYLIFLSIFSCCSCSDAAPKVNMAALECPLTLPAKKDISSDWLIVGETTNEKLPLKSIGIIYSDTSDIPARNFDVEMIEEWENLKDKTQAVAEYYEDHKNIMLKCIYASSNKDAADDNVNNVVLLIPLPPKKHLVCLLTNRTIDPKFELSCKEK